jgi:preprotein translocase subunit SecA
VALHAETLIQRDIDYVVESVEPIVRKLRSAMPVGAR